MRHNYPEGSEPVTDEYLQQDPADDVDDDCEEFDDEDE